MSPTSSTQPAEPGADAQAGRRDPPLSALPPEMREALCGLGLLAASANIVMQLARLPVGHGVARSRVTSGRADVHPLKRNRTTLSFLAIAVLGTDEERRALRHQINGAHRQVHSLPGDPVTYNALDPELQLWVAACLTQGFHDVYVLLHPDPAPETLDRLYAYSARFGTTLQVRSSQWPPDRAAFARYWEAGVATIQMDDVTRTYLNGIVDNSLLFTPLGVWGRPLAALAAPLGRTFTGGFLPAPFRHELGMTWTAKDQRRFERWLGVALAVHRRAPRLLREFPYNLALWDTRRRMRRGRPVI